LGAIYSQKGQLQPAYDAFRRYLDLEPASPTAMSNLAGLLSQFGRHDEAIGMARQALQIDPAFAPAHQLLWKLLAATRRSGEALAALRAACAALPGDIALKRQLVVMLVNSARPDAAGVQQALDLARECCQREPKVAENFDALGMARAAAGDFAGAADAAQQAIALAQAQGQMNLAGRIAARLQAYQAGRRP
jgi:tetratricopeptide (TPR) repeat protein